MALIDKASLLMVPSVYEDGTLYNVLPSGNKAPDETGNHNGYDQTRADFTFSRGSNLAATRVNSDGLIEKGRENLILQSNQFDTTWVNSNSSETSGQSGYDGSSDAWLLTASIANGFIYQDITISGVNTFSVYAKAGSQNGMTLYSAHASQGRYFNLSTGALGGAFVGAPIASSIDAIGGGWYRCSITINASANNNFRIYVSDGSTNTDGTIYIQDAQLEKSLVATDYIETGSVSGTAGVLENTPRIDYSSGAGALLLESQRTNLLPYSEYITGWTSKSAVYHTNGANATTSPEGISNGWKITGDGTTGQHYVLQTSSYTSGTSYTCSIYAKADTLNYVQLIMGAAAFGSTRYCNFDLSDGSIGSQGVDISNPFAESMGNGWYRIGFTCSAISTASGNFFPVLIESKTSSFFEVNSTTSSIFLYGGQVEAGSHVSSYVPTYGSAATRGADSCSVTGVSDVIGQTEGTIFLEFEFSKDIDAAYRVSLSDGTTNNRIQLGTYGNEVQVYVQTSGVTQVFAFGGTISVGTHKMALAYATNDYVAYLDGSAVITDTSASVPACSKLEYRIPDGTGLFEHPIKQQVLFNERLSNTELAALTA